MKRLPYVINYAAMVMGLGVVFEYVFAVYVSGGYGPDSVASGILSSTSVYVLVISSIVAVATLVSCAAIAVKPVRRRLAASGLVLGMVVLPISVAYLQGADVPTTVFNCPMQPAKPAGVLPTDSCHNDVAYYAGGMSAGASLLDTGAIVIGVLNLYFTWRRPTTSLTKKA